jgi:hypothetical protein
MGASLCVNRVALAQNLGLEYLRSCDTQLDRTAVRIRVGLCGGALCSPRLSECSGENAGLLPIFHWVLSVQILFLSQMFVKISKDHRLMTVRVWRSASMAEHRVFVVFVLIFSPVSALICAVCDDH